MFGTHDLALFVVSGILLNITPGADTLYIVSRSAASGAKAGAFAALGIGAGCFVHIFAAALGLSAILAASATAFLVVKLVGAAYLVYLGVAMFRPGCAYQRAQSQGRAVLSGVSASIHRFGHARQGHRVSFSRACLQRKRNAVESAGCAHRRDRGSS